MDIVGHISARRRVAKEVSDEIIKGLNAGTMSLEDARAIARETLAILDEIERHEDLVLSFYEKMAEKYTVFKLLYTRVKGEILKAREIAEYRAALIAIEAGNVAEANEILKAAIAETANETTELK